MLQLSGRIESGRKANERGTKEQKEEFAFLQRLLTYLEEGKDVRMGEWAAHEIEYLNKQQLLTAKPVIYLVNLSAADYIRKKGKFLPALGDWLKARGTDDKMIPFSCEFEQKLADMDPESRAKYCAEVDAQSALPRIIRTGYRALNLIHYFTAGEDEASCLDVTVVLSALCCVSFSCRCVGGR